MMMDNAVKNSKQSRELVTFKMAIYFQELMIKLGMSRKKMHRGSLKLAAISACFITFFLIFTGQPCILHAACHKSTLFN